MKYIALEEFNFIWEEAQVAEIQIMWDEGLSIGDIGVAFNRDPDEVAVLIMDLRRKQALKKRKGGAWGNRRPC